MHHGVLVVLVTTFQPRVMMMLDARVTHRSSGARGKARLNHFLHHFLHDRLIRFLLRLNHNGLPLFRRELP
jgi:hypothetical protein